MIKEDPTNSTTESNHQDHHTHAKISRRRILGVAGAAAITGVLLGNRVGLTSPRNSVTDDVYGDVSAYPAGKAEGIRRIVEEVLQEYEQRFGDDLADTKDYIDAEVLRVQTMKKPFSNTDGAVTKVLNTALSYMNRANIVYGNYYTPFSDYMGTTPEGKFELDCSSFIQCCITGTAYGNCRYFNDVNYYDESFYPLVNDDRWYGRMLAHHIGKYCYDNGMSYVPKTDWSNARVGDLIFLSNSGEEGFWNQIGHVMLISRLDQKGAVTVIECVSGQATAVVERTYTHAQLNGSKKAYLCGRIPLHDTSGNIQCISYEAYRETIDATRVLTMAKPLNTHQMYTLFIRGTFPGGSYPIIRTGPNSNYNVYSFAGSVKKRPDNMYKVNFFIPEGKLGSPTTLDILSASSPGGVIIDFAALFEGYVTACPQNVDHILPRSQQTTLTKTVTIAAATTSFVSFVDEINGVLDERYYYQVDVSVAGTLASKVMASMNQSSRKYVSLLNTNDVSVTIEARVTVTQVLK